MHFKHLFNLFTSIINEIRKENVLGLKIRHDAGKQMYQAN